MIELDKETMKLVNNLLRRKSFTRDDLKTLLTNAQIESLLKSEKRKGKIAFDNVAKIWRKV